MAAKILNYGSLNIDRVYSVDTIVQEGQTISARQLSLFAGGKGLNQSVALARAGMQVYQAGGVGEDGQMLLDCLCEAGVHTDFVRQRSSLTGHAVIQVDQDGRNCIIITAGANHGNTEAEIQETLHGFGQGDLVLMQNEIDGNESIIRTAKAKGLTVAFNPSPLDGAALSLPLELVDIFLLNEHEAAGLIAARQPEKAVDPDEPLAILTALQKLFPRVMFVLTLGARGSMCADREGKIYQQDVFPVQAVDTTAAGDSFTGFFLAAILEGRAIPEALRRASAAAGIAVSRAGAAPSIPTLKELEKMLGD